MLWFAWKFVPLWYQQQHSVQLTLHWIGCDLLENSYLCGINNNKSSLTDSRYFVVICLKIRTFVVSTTTHYITTITICGLWFAWKFVPLWYQQQLINASNAGKMCCDLLENSYLCGINNNTPVWRRLLADVVICLKIRTFVVSTTTNEQSVKVKALLWFAWKFVPLWYQQQQEIAKPVSRVGCDLLENSYLCGINNNCIS